MSSERVNKALENHAKGYNCAQAVACAFCDVFGVDEKTAFRMAEAFGFGMGTMSVCGALSGAAVCAGLKNSDGQIDDPKTKKSTYALIKKMTEEFREKAGSSICREIKGVDTGKLLTSCDDCIKIAAEIVEKECLE